MQRRDTIPFLLAASLGVLALPAATQNLVLERAAALSADAASAGSAESARETAFSAFAGFERPRPAVTAGGWTGALQEAPVAGISQERKTSEPPKPSISERRREIRRQRAFGRTVRAVGLGIVGFLGGLILGALLGAAAAAAFFITAPNPDLKIAKWLLLLPAIAVGAVAGQVAAPFLGAALLGSSEPHD